MAKNEEQKAANKEASLLKKAAHSARTTEHRETVEAAKIVADIGATALEYEQAKVVEEAAFKLMGDSEKEIEAQIAVLKDKITAIHAEHHPRVEEFRLIKKQAAIKFYAERSRLQAEAEAKFPDLEETSARWSSVAWVPPEGYIEKFAAEHSVELARKKAKRDKKRVSDVITATIE